MKDSLGDRMKADYENRTRYMLPREELAFLVSGARDATS